MQRTSAARNLRLFAIQRVALGLVLDPCIKQEQNSVINANHLLGIMIFIQIEIENATLKDRKPTAAMTSTGDAAATRADRSQAPLPNWQVSSIVELNRRVDI